MLMQWFVIGGHQDTVQQLGCAHFHTADSLGSAEQIRTGERCPNLGDYKRMQDRCIGKAVQTVPMIQGAGVSKEASLP